jgi:hypothetical protein
MNWQHTRLTLSPISGAVLLTACAGAEVRPIVDMNGVNEARYEKDLAECQEYVKEASGMGGTAAEGAGAGALIGGGGGAYKGNESQEAVVKKMSRGSWVQSA